MSKNNSNAPMDLDNPEAVDTALANAAAEAAATPTATTPKTKKPRILKITCPDCGKEFDYEIPAGTHRVGANVGIALTDMDEAQLRIELRNASSVLFKTKKRPTATAEQIEKAQSRVDAVKAEFAAKGITLATRTSKELTAEDIASLIKSGKVNVEELQKYLDAAPVDGSVNA